MADLVVVGSYNAALTVQSAHTVRPDLTELLLKEAFEGNKE